MIRRAALVSVGLAAIACMLHVSACKDDGTHVFTGRFFVEGRDCLGTSAAIDVLSGDEPGDCSAICLVQRRGEGGRAVYVSTMCPPYPPPGIELDTAGTDPACPRALAALARGDTCLSDGGSTRPAPVPEAGADASTDAAGD